MVVVAVDDNALVLGGTVAMLEDLGHTAGPATSGQQAFDVVRRKSDVALVIANQVMLGMSSVERCASLKTRDLASPPFWLQVSLRFPRG